MIASSSEATALPIHARSGFEPSPESIVGVPLPEAAGTDISKLHDEVHPLDKRDGFVGGDGDLSLRRVRIAAIRNAARSASKPGNSFCSDDTLALTAAP